jgi:hypothetical protein
LSCLKRADIQREDCCIQAFRIIKFKAASIAKGKTQDDRDLKILYTLENILGSKDMETREKTVMIF